MKDIKKLISKYCRTVGQMRSQRLATHGPEIGLSQMVSQLERISGYNQLTLNQQLSSTDNHSQMKISPTEYHWVYDPLFWGGGVGQGFSV